MHKGHLHILVLAVVVVGWTPAAFGQLNWIERFDNYPVGQLVPQGGWEGWDQDVNAAESPVTAAQSFTEPHSVRIEGNDDLVRVFSGYESGVWALSCRQYIPENFSGEHYFIMLNEYNHGGPYNWSLQVAQNSQTNQTLDVDGGNNLPLIKGRWVELKVVMNLDTDEQTIFYDGVMLTVKSWKEGASGGGETNFACLDLFANGASAVYYDSFLLRQVSPEGACCFLDGTCQTMDTAPDCEGVGGIFRGATSLCSTSFCPEYAEDGWVVTAPLLWRGDTCVDPEGGNPDSCDIVEFTPDSRFAVELPWYGDWTFSLCGAPWDTYMALGNSPCSDDVIADDDGCGTTTASYFEVTAGPGTFYLTIEAFEEGARGQYTLTIDGACEVVATPGIPDEAEPECGTNYEDLTNAGCDADPPIFLDIACAGAFDGEAGTYRVQVPVECPTDVNGNGETDFQDLLDVLFFWGPCDGECPADVDGNNEVDFQDLLEVLFQWGECPNQSELEDRRDTDWYRLELDEPTTITFNGVAEFWMDTMLLDGSNGCDTPAVIDSQAVGPCQPGAITQTLDAGVYYLWAAPRDFTGVLCGRPYRISVNCSTP